jgi:hypothetical protein
MNKNKAAIVILVLFAYVLAPESLLGQESSRYEPISAEELREVLEDVGSWTAETIIFRENAKEMDARRILERANAIRVKFDPVMVLMATTEPEPVYKPASVMLLMGAKGVELALWHYIYAIIGNSEKAKEHGDSILGAAVNQIQDARELFSRLP